MDIPRIEQKIDKAQDISLNILLGIFTVIIMAASLALGIASAVLIIGFTSLRLSIRYACQLYADLQSSPQRQTEEPIILGSYRRRTYRRPSTKNTLVQRYNLYVPFA